MNEKFKQIIEFFKEEDIELPIDVNNAIEDVFNENDEVEKVDIYFRKDASVFEDDLRLSNTINAHVDKPSTGSVNAVFTYYGNIQYSLSEFIRVYNNDQEEEEVTVIDNLERPSVLDQDSYAVVLVENIEWENGNLNREPHLYIYCPEEGVE
jgi:hypothetical protein